MSPVHWSAAGLAVTTGVIHLYLFIEAMWLPFLVAGVVFFGAVGAMIALPYGHVARRSVYLLGIPFTAGQIAGWYLLDGQLSAVAVGDKLVQVILIFLLIYLFVVETRNS